MDNSVILYKIEKYKNKLANSNDEEKKYIYQQKLNYYMMIGGAPCNPTEYSNLRNFLINYFNSNDTSLDKVFNGHYGTDDQSKRFTWEIYRKTLMPNMQIPLNLRGPNYNNIPMLPTQINLHGNYVNNFFYPPLLEAYRKKYPRTQLSTNIKAAIAEIKECFRTINRDMLQKFLLKPHDGNGKINDDTLMTTEIFRKIFKIHDPRHSRPK